MTKEYLPSLTPTESIVLDLLEAEGRLTAKICAERMGLSNSAAYLHLSSLTKMGLVKKVLHGKQHVYSVVQKKPEPVADNHQDRNDLIKLDLDRIESDFIQPSTTAMFWDLLETLERVDSICHALGNVAGAEAVLAAEKIIQMHFAMTPTQK